MNADTTPVCSERCGPVLVITLDRSQARNAVDGAVAAGLERAVDLLEADTDLRAGVLAATGPVFCAGADLAAVAAGRFDELLTERGGFAGFVRRDRTKPVVAALDGDALAGGMEIAITCDLIVAAEGVRLGIPETARSLLAVGGALANLPRLIGEKAALEMALTAKPWSAEHLAQLGLISRIVARGTARDEALSLATEIARNAPLAVQATRRAVVNTRDLNEGDRWKFAQQELDALRASRDYQEGLDAFLEKRAPHWTGP